MKYDSMTIIVILISLFLVLFIFSTSVSEPFMWRRGGGPSWSWGNGWWNNWRRRRPIVRRPILYENVNYY